MGETRWTDGHWLLNLLLYSPRNGKSDCGWVWMFRTNMYGSDAITPPYRLKRLGPLFLAKTRKIKGERTLSKQKWKTHWYHNKRQPHYFSGTRPEAELANRFKCRRRSCFRSRQRGVLHIANFRPSLVGAASSERCKLAQAFEWSLVLLLVLGALSELLRSDTTNTCCCVCEVCVFSCFWYHPACETYASCFPVFLYRRGGINNLKYNLKRPCLTVYAPGHCSYLYVNSTPEGVHSHHYGISTDVQGYHLTFLSSAFSSHFWTLVVVFVA